MSKYVYFFGGGKAEGKAEMKNLLGGKGANLAEMTNIGLPVPPGFTLTTEICTHYYANNHQYPPELRKEVDAALRKTEEIMDSKYGDAKNPLLVSCRSGARVSMPGMMDTVLNIGLNDTTVKGLIEQTKNERFAWDSYRRFVQMYGDVVMDLKPQDKKEIDPFEKIIDEVKHAKGIHLDTDLSTDDLKDLVRRYKEMIKRRKGQDFPDDPMGQLWGAIGAVFGSWMNERAKYYRQQNNIPHDWGTAANVQAMVFGNMGNDCATGVGFTRNPATGDNVFFGDYLINAQGEDVVAGIRAPKNMPELKKDMPETYAQLEKIRATLEKHYRDMQDIEFTVQKGTLFMLQTRTGKRTGFAAVRMALDMFEEKLISKEEALRRVEPDSLNQLLQPIFDAEAKRKAIKEGKLLAKGINAGPGAATGKICFHADEAEKLALKGEKVILVRRETSPEDIRGMAAAQGILTAQGGASSHAALVSRQMGKVCVVGCTALDINYGNDNMKVGERILRPGDWISIDGFTGEVLADKVATLPSEVVQVLINKTLKPEQSKVYQQFAQLMNWADEHRKLKVRTNADLPDQASAAVAFGAEGIGLCRTEHMFFDVIDAMREMILADEVEERKRALAKLLPIQREDFEGIFQAMNGLPVTIRTLDPPLHEFLPHTHTEQAELAQKIGVPVEDVARRVQELHEFNPMLGHRGCRLGIVYPEITEMQARAIFEAACNVKKAGTDVHPEIMIPLVGFLTELKAQAQVVRSVAKQVFAEKGIEVEYQIGTMIELPRACVAADQIAQEAQFFSFGTNDLTQTTLGMSRDDYGPFMRVYLDPDHNIVAKDPFQTIDVDGVGGLMKLGVEKGRATRPDLKVGICGEHGGDPDTVKFCHTIGLNYVSCSPYRVPIARLAAAQAALKK